MKKNFIILLCFLSFLFVGKVQPQEKEIFVSEVKIEPVSGKGNLKAMAEIVINNCLKIREIRVLKIGDQTKLKFPYYVSRRGEVYPQVIVHTQQANEVIQKAVEKDKISLSTGTVPEGQSPWLDYEITKMTPFTQFKQLKAFAAVTFNKAITVECKIMSGKKGLWVSWPASAAKTKGEPWAKQVIILDRELKENIERDLFVHYHEKKE